MASPRTPDAFFTVTAEAGWLDIPAEPLSRL